MIPRPPVAPAFPVRFRFSLSSRLLGRMNEAAPAAVAVAVSDGCLLRLLPPRPPPSCAPLPRPPVPAADWGMKKR